LEDDIQFFRGVHPGELGGGNEVDHVC
jgi:hypothetical protein